MQIKLHGTRLVMALLFFLLSAVASSAIGADVNGDNNPPINYPISFRGAELYADILGDGKVVVHLKKYYDCGMPAGGENETVSIQESETMNSKQIVLNKETSNTRENAHLQTSENPKAGCLSVVVYSKEIDLGRFRSTYNITWGYCCFNVLNNLADGNRSGTALALEIKNDGEMKANSMPSLSNLPSFILKKNANGSMVNKVTDAEQDAVSLSITAPNSLTSYESYPVAGNANNSLNNNIVAGSIITDKAPFKKVVYKQGYSETNPLKGKVFSIDEKTGEFRYQPGEVGKYLVAVTLKEYREKEKISEHQCVFIIDVQ